MTNASRQLNERLYGAGKIWRATRKSVVARDPTFARGGKRLQGFVDYPGESSDLHIYGCL